MVEADEVGADVLVFVRDRDGDEERAAAIEEGLRLAREGTYSAKVVGGVAVEEIEAWILALLGERRSEHPKDAKRVLRNRHGIADLGGKRAVVEDANLGNFPEDANLDALPDDAVSLRAWLTRVREAFASPI